MIKDDVPDKKSEDELVDQRGEISKQLSNENIDNQSLGVDHIGIEIISVEPKYAFIMVGINDIYQNISIEDIFVNYVEIVRKLQEKDIFVVIQSTIQCELSKCGQKRVSKVNELNALLSAFASKNDIEYLNLGKLTDVRGLDASYTTDGVHLNMEGYRTWVDILSPKLEQLLGF